MKKRIMKGFGILAVVLIVVGIMGSKNAYAADTQELTTDQLTTEEMLILALEDEYAAYYEYSAIVNAYGESRPFINLLAAEENHINALEQLFTAYGIVIPEMSQELPAAPASLEEAYSLGITAETESIALYENLLSQNPQDDIAQVFEYLKDASVRHLEALNRSSGCNNCDSTSRLNQDTGRNSRGSSGRNNNGRNSSETSSSKRNNSTEGSCLYNCILP